MCKNLSLFAPSKKAIGMNYPLFFIGLILLAVPLLSSCDEEPLDERSAFELMLQGHRIIETRLAGETGAQKVMTPDDLLASAGERVLVDSVINRVERDAKGTALYVSATMKGQPVKGVVRCSEELRREIESFRYTNVLLAVQVTRVDAFRYPLRAEMINGRVARLGTGEDVMFSGELIAAAETPTLYHYKHILHQR